MAGHAHGHHHHDHGAADSRALTTALSLILTFMVAEVVAGILAHSLALLSDAGHMLTDAAALALSLVAARIAARPAGGAMTYGHGRAEILSAQANGLTLLVLALLIVYGAVVRLVHPAPVDGGTCSSLALVGIAVNLAGGVGAAAAGRAAEPQPRGLLPPHPHRPLRLHRHRDRRRGDPAHRVPRAPTRWRRC